MKFQTAFWCVKAGVQKGAVGLACPGQDICAFFQQQNTSAVQRKPPRGGHAGHPGADDRDIEAFQWGTSLTLGLFRVFVGMGMKKCPNSQYILPNG